MKYRQEKDSMGTVRVPEDAYYGSQTQRAADNFPISDMRFPPIFIRSLALVKRFAARVNSDLGLLDAKIAEALRQNVWPLLEAGRIAPIVDSEFGLEEASDAHALMERSAHIGKIVLRVGG